MSSGWYVSVSCRSSAAAASSASTSASACWVVGVWDWAARKRVVERQRPGWRLLVLRGFNRGLEEAAAGARRAPQGSDDGTKPAGMAVRNLGMRRMLMCGVDDSIGGPVEGCRSVSRVSCHGREQDSSSQNFHGRWGTEVGLPGPDQPHSSAEHCCSVACSAKQLSRGPPSSGQKLWLGIGSSEVA